MGIVKTKKYVMADRINYKEEPMKKYLFGLGAMLVGAGLMFVLMHGEVRAENATRIKWDKGKCEEFVLKNGSGYIYCQINDLTCVSDFKGLSCVKS